MVRRATRRRIPEARLQPVTKSVLFYRGMTDDTDRFLSKSPSVDYTENLYEEKDGSYSKRPGFEALPSIGLKGSDDGNPFMLHSVGDTLYTMATEKSYSFKDAAWEEVENKGDLRSLSLEIPVRTQPHGGARDFTMCIPRVGDFYCIAFNIKTADVTNVIVQTYATDGTFRGEQRFEGRDPQLFATNLSSTWQGTLVYLYYTKTGIIRRRLYNPALNQFVGSDNAIVSNAWPGDWSRTGAALEEYWRIGFSHHDFEHLNTAYHIVHHTVGDRAAIFTKVDHLQLNELDASGFTTGTTVTVQTLDGDTIGQPLAMAIEPDGSSVAVMYVRRTISTGLDEVVVQRHNFPFTGTKVWEEILFAEVAAAKYVGHGSLAFSPGGSVVFAIYHLAPVEGQFWSERNFSLALDGSNLEYEQLVHATGSSTGFGGSIFAQRLASKAVVVGDQFYAVLQQWSAYTPERDLPRLPANIDNSIIPPQTKPVSSVLCRFKQDSEIQIIAVLGANASRWTSPTSDETTTRLPDLLYENDKFYHTNRQILTPEDVMHLVKLPSAGKVRNSAASQSIAPEQGLGVLNVISSDVQDIVSNSFGNAVAVSTAAPTWLSGSSLTEAFIIDRPEIVGLAITGTYFTAVYWEPADSDTSLIRRMQLVVGYTDAAGNIHRSAPSSVVWWTVDFDTGRRVSVYFTPPLSAFSDRRDYFVELYVSSKDTDNLKLAASRPIQVGVADVWTDFVIEFDASIEATDEPTDSFKPARSSKNVYTTGGILASMPWPSIKDAVVASRRFWLISKQFPGSVFYSKLFEENVAPELASELIIPLGEERDLLCIGTLDDKAIVFEKNDIHVIYGDGPDNRGKGRDFAVEYITTGAIGCEDPKSVIETPVGLMFYNRARGFFILDRDRQLRYVGAGVKNLSKGITIKAATVDPRESEVRFLVEAGTLTPIPGHEYGPAQDAPDVDRPPTPVFTNTLPEDSCLSFNYESGIWALYKNYAGLASTLHQGRYTQVGLDASDNWTVWKESPLTWRDPTGTNRTLMRSHWIELGQQVQDYERLWRITLLGRYLSSLKDLGGQVYEAGDIIVRLYYDYEALPTQEVRFYMQDFGYSPFNSPLKRTERLQCVITPNRGRCQDVKIEIEEINSEDRGEGLTYALGRGFEIVSADFKLGLYEPTSTRLISTGVRK